jgi:hypothetical protein
VEPPIGTRGTHRTSDRLRLSRRSLLGVAGLVFLLAALAPFLRPVAG